MIKKLTFLIMSTALLMSLAACSSSSKSSDNTAATNNGTTTAPSDPQTIAIENCSSCHGDKLHGLSGPSLQKIGEKYSKEQISAIIKNGTGSMPGGIITGNNADKVAAWLADKK